MKVIFLDIDGVLNTGIRNYSFDWVIAECIERVNTLIEMHNASVVLTTSWRIEHDLSFLRNRLRNYGLEASHIIDMTEVIDIDMKTSHIITPAPRAWEILMWLQDHSHYNISNFVILDDTNIFEGAITMEIPELTNHFVHVGGSLGITDTDLRLAHEILSNEDL